MVNYNLLNINEESFALLVYKMLRKCGNGIVKIKSVKTDLSVRMVVLEGIKDIQVHENKIVLKGEKNDAILEFEESEKIEISACIEDGIVNIYED